MPDLSHLIEVGNSHAWVYLPLALVLGALHALEPGHAKSMMAAYIVSVRGTPRDASLLGLSAAVGHTFVVWILAIAALALGRTMIVEEAEPWLMLISGVLVFLLAVRMLLRIGQPHHHHHTHEGHHRREASSKSQATVRKLDIVWFGFTGGLLPCPAAIAVLLVCIHLKQFALGVVMVAAFSVGLALTLVAIGVAASWAANKASAKFPLFDWMSDRLPYFSAAIVMVMGFVLTVAGLNAAGLSGPRKPS